MLAERVVATEVVLYFLVIVYAAFSLSGKVNANGELVR